MLFRTSLIGSVCFRTTQCLSQPIDLLNLPPLQNLCFTKKVRYKSRKQLANARPRVRGQFVRVNSEVAVEVLDGCEPPASPEALAAAVAAGTARVLDQACICEATAATDWKSLSTNVNS